MGRVAALVPAYQAAAHLGEVLLGLGRAGRAARGAGRGRRLARRHRGGRARSTACACISFAGQPRQGLRAARRLRGARATSTPSSRSTPTASTRPSACRPSCRPREAGADLVLGRARDHARHAAAAALRQPVQQRLVLARSPVSGSRTASAAIGSTAASCCAARPSRASRYEVETEIAVRAARLGFRVAEVPIPTVYGDETSHLSITRDVPRIVGMMVAPDVRAAAAMRGPKGS